MITRCNDSIFCVDNDSHTHQQPSYSLFCRWHPSSINTGENLFRSSDERDTRTSQPTLTVFALKSVSVDPVGGSNNLDMHVFVVVALDVVIELRP